MQIQEYVQHQINSSQTKMSVKQYFEMQKVGYQIFFLLLLSCQFVISGEISTVFSLKASFLFRDQSF